MKSLIPLGVRLRTCAERAVFSGVSCPASPAIINNLVL